MPYTNKDKERAAKRKWRHKNRGKNTRTLEPLVKLEPKRLEPSLEPVKTRDVFIGGARYNVPI